MSPIRFGVDEAQSACDEWGFNCGPGALCAVLHMTPAELRPHLRDFERKRYTNPTLMLDILRDLKIPHRLVYRSDEPRGGLEYPEFGLIRIQWGGTWTKPGVPMKARYRYTHWVACRWGDCAEHTCEMFDVNAVCAGGWLKWDEWAGSLIPWLIRECVPRCDGTWWPTHMIQVFKGSDAA